MWFDYPDDPDGGRVEIQNLDESDIAAITAKSFTNRTAYNEELKRPLQEQQYSALVDRQETVVRAVVNWENFFDQVGKLMKCSEAAKRKWACSNDFMAFVNEKRAIVEEAARKQTEEKRKN